MSHCILGGFGTLRKFVARRWAVTVGVMGGRALGLTALAGMLQSIIPLHRPVEIPTYSHVLHDRVQRVREALHTADEAPVDRVIGSRLAHWNKYRD